jgi:hypothetical protein
MSTAAGAAASSCSSWRLLAPGPLGSPRGPDSTWTLRSASSTSAKSHEGIKNLSSLPAEKNPSSYPANKNKCHVFLQELNAYRTHQQIDFQRGHVGGADVGVVRGRRCRWTAADCCELSAREGGQQWDPDAARRSCTIVLVHRFPTCTTGPAVCHKLTQRFGPRTPFSPYRRGCVYTELYRLAPLRILTVLTIPRHVFMV